MTKKNLKNHVRGRYKRHSLNSPAVKCNSYSSRSSWTSDTVQLTVQFSRVKMIYSTCMFLCYYLGTSVLLLAFTVLRLLKLIPCTQWIISEFVNKISTIQMPREDYWDSLFTWPMLSSKRSSMLLELQKTASWGKIAPDSQLISVDGKSRYRLLEFCRGNRPLVVNFGSWTCPVFRTRVNEFLSIVREFRDVADFLTIYVEEAHPTNGWKLEVSACQKELSDNKD